MTRSPSTSLRAIAVFMMMPPMIAHERKEDRWAATLRDGTAFSAVAPSQRPVCDAHQSEYSETVFRSCPPGPNTWTLNIQPLGQFRPHRGFLLARPTLLSTMARLLHTAGCRAAPSLCGLRLARTVPCPALANSCTAANASSQARTAAISLNGCYGIFGARGSPRLCAGELDYFAPLLGIVSDELAEIRDRAGKYHAPKVGKPRLQLGISEPRIDLAIELINDLGRRVFGRTEANPLARLETRHEIANGRDVRQGL